MPWCGAPGCGCTEIPAERAADAAWRRSLPSLSLQPLGRCVVRLPGRADMAEPQRIIERKPENPEHEQWQGRSAHDAKVQPTVWKGKHVESVIRQMDDALGAWPEDAYVVEDR